MQLVDFTETFARFNFFDNDFIYFFNNDMSVQILENSRDQMVERLRNKQTKHLFNTVLNDLSRYIDQSTAFIYDSDV